MGRPWLLVCRDCVANFTRNATISALGRSIEHTAILPDTIQMLKRSRWIALVEVDVMHPQAGRRRRAKDEDAHTAQQLRLQRVERIIACAVNPGIAQTLQPAQEAPDKRITAEEPEAEVAARRDRRQRSGLRT